MFMRPCIVTNFFIIKPTRCTNFTNLFWNEILQVSDSSSVHHQEFIHCTLSNGTCHTGLQRAFEQDYMFRTVRLSIIRGLFIVHSAMVYVIQVCRQLSSRTHASDTSPVHYQEFIHCTLSNGTYISHTAFEQDHDGTAVPSWSCSIAVYKPA